MANTITDTEKARLVTAGFATGSLRDCQMAELADLGSTTGSYADRCVAEELPQYP